MKELNMQLPYDIGDEVWVQEHGEFVETFRGKMDYTRVPMRGIVQDITIYMKKDKGTSCEYTIIGDNGWYHILNNKEVYSTREDCQRACYIYNRACIEGTIKFNSGGYAYEC